MFRESVNKKSIRKALGLSSVVSQIVKVAVEAIIDMTTDLVNQIVL